MNRIILIGNGFDLAHGLKTTYCDFMNHFWKGVARKIPECMFEGFEHEFVKFERTGGPESFYDACIATDYGVARNFRDENSYRYQDCFGQGIIPEFCKALTEVESYLNLKKLIAEVNELSDLQFKLSFSNSFFKHLSETLALNSWIDIENEYYQQLKDISPCNAPKLESVAQLHKEFDQVKHHLANYLKKACEQETSAISGIKNIFNSKIDIKEIAVSKKQSYVDYMKWMLEENSIDSNFYIEEELKNHHPELANNRDQALIEAIKHNEELTKYSIPQQTLLVNFNYTDTAEKLYPKPDDRAGDYEVIHIHGELDKPNTMIFGYGDEIDEDYKNIVNLNKNDYLKNIKSIRYLETDHYRNLLSFISFAPYQIFIMGHSCGNSDRTLLNTLFEHKNCVSIKPFYHRKNDGTEDYINIIQNMSRNFKDATLMRDRVVNKTYCEPHPQIREEKV